jgi:membrane associated rhomboid family serine protease
MAVCYRHKDRETGVSCSNCGRPICPDCMTPTPVGMRCPECSRDRTPTKTLRTLHGEPVATYALIALCVLLWLGEYLSGGRGGGVADDLSLIAAAQDPSTGQEIGVAAGEWWRLITGGFLHDARNPLHILFNMYVLYWLGTMLEPVLGRARFLAVYFASLLTGALGAIALSPPNQGTVGASGAVFGLMGAAFVLQRLRGVNPMQSGIGGVIVLNLGLSFLIPGISIGGHIGGLIGGALCALLLERLGTLRRGALLPVAGCAAVGIAAAVAAVVVSHAKAASIGLAAISLFS